MDGDSESHPADLVSPAASTSSAASASSTSSTSSSSSSASSTQGSRLGSDAGIDPDPDGGTGWIEIRDEDLCFNGTPLRLLHEESERVWADIVWRKANWDPDVERERGRGRRRRRRDLEK